MQKVNWKWVGIALAISLGLILILSILLYPEKTFRRMDIDSNVYIKNTVEAEYLDTIVYLGLKELKIDSLFILIREFEDETEIDGYTLDGSIVSIPNSRNQYLIFVKNNFSRRRYIKILSHELIHLKQYYTGELIPVYEDTTVIWRGNKIKDFQNLPYLEREWEIEAYSEGPKLERKLLKALY